MPGGNYQDILINKQSVTGKYLNKNISKHIARNTSEMAVQIKGAKANNLKQIDVNIPAKCLTAITGVSGSGKSSLAFEVIKKSWNTHTPVYCSSIEFSGLMICSDDQESIGTSPHSNLLLTPGF